MSAFDDLITAIAGGDEARALKLIAKSPSLARARAAEGATRQQAKPFFFEEIAHYVYAGDTALHVAAAAHLVAVARALIDAGADVHARNRRQAASLHYAVDGNPAGARWDPRAQAATVNLLLDAGAEVDAVDAGGVTPLHRATRNRCAAAVRALLDGGADTARTNKSGSTALDLARWTTGRGGSGSAAAKAEQEQILALLRSHSHR